MNNKVKIITLITLIAAPLSYYAYLVISAKIMFRRMNKKHQVAQMTFEEFIKKYSE